MKGLFCSYEAARIAGDTARIYFDLRGKKRLRIGSGDPIQLFCDGHEGGAFAYLSGHETIRGAIRKMRAFVKLHRKCKK